MVVIPLFFNFGMDKHTDFPSNKTVHFIATQLRVSGGHFRTVRRLLNKNVLRMVIMDTKFIYFIYFCQISKIMEN